MIFLRRSFRQGVQRPDLTVRVRVGAAHDGAFVLKDLHPAIGMPQVGDLLCPGVDHLADIRHRHLGQGQVVAGRETNHAAGAGYRAGGKQLRLRLIRGGGARQQRREIVLEDVRRCVRRVLFAARPAVPRAQVASRVISGQILRRSLLHLPEPGALGAVRRDQQPLAGERIKASMRRFERLGRHGQSQL